MPRQGPLIVAINHLSLLDPILVGAALPRPVHFMAKEELFRYPLLGLLLRWVRAFPVRRGEADREAIASGLRILQAGGVVGIFPEGTRSLDGRLLSLQGGTAFLALKSGAPIVPVAISGTERAMPKGAWWPRRVAVRIQVGTPIQRLPDNGAAFKDRLQELSRSLAQELARLLNQPFSGEPGSSSAI